MSWLGDLWKKIKGEKADDLVLISSLTIPGETPEDIEADGALYSVAKGHKLIQLDRVWQQPATTVLMGK